jgi:uncharacterized protein YoxC
VEVVALFRDLAIILLAVETMVIGIVVLVLVWQLWKLLGLLSRHVDTLSASVNTILGRANTQVDTLSTSANSILGNANDILGKANTHVDTLSTSANSILGSANSILGNANDILGDMKSGTSAAAETAHQAKTTVSYVGSRTVIPVIELYAIVNGASRFAQALFRPKPRHEPSRGDEDE